MFQMRFHGRGGQGMVIAAELLASAAFREDRYSQAFRLVQGLRPVRRRMPRWRDRDGARAVPRRA